MSMIEKYLHLQSISTYNSIFQAKLIYLCIGYTALSLSGSRKRKVRTT